MTELNRRHLRDAGERMKTMINQIHEPWVKNDREAMWQEWKTKVDRLDSIADYLMEIDPDERSRHRQILQKLNASKSTDPNQTKDDT